MNEISLILRNKISITLEEYKVLEDTSYIGRTWVLIQRPTSVLPFFCSYRTIEYIFEPEALTFFYIISRNVLATWKTDITRDFGPNDEFQLRDSLFIRPYAARHIT